MNGGSWGAFGGGLFGHDSTELTATGDPVGNQTDLYGTGNKIVMSCVTCHDPHGSSNYRILKDVVNGNVVGGYDGSASGTDPFGNAYSAQNPKPNPYVISNEVGFPQGGFQLHVSYIGTYVPSYTTALYAIPTASGATSKGMTGWCVACHTTYNIASRVTFNGNPNYINDSTSVYNAGDAAKLVARHRHPMNVPLSNYAGASSVVVSDTSLGLPVDHPTSQKRTTVSPVYVAGQYNGDNWIECLTCHNAHGSVATMSGWSDLGLKATVDVVGSRGVMPVDSNLLKLNNRAVCENCHNK
jgi:cytochrome c553